MPEVGDFGERAATEAEIEAWDELVRAGKRASHGFRNRPDQTDNMRPVYGSGRASSEGEE